MYIFSRLKLYKIYKNWLRLANVIVKNIMSRFNGSLCIICLALVLYAIAIGEIKMNKIKTCRKTVVDLCSMFLQSSHDRGTVRWCSILSHTTSDLQYSLLQIWFNVCISSKRTTITSIIVIVSLIMYTIVRSKFVLRTIQKIF